MLLLEEMAQNNDLSAKNSLGNYLKTREENLILDLILPTKGETFLEVGCGTGDHLLLFHNRGCNVTGIETSASLMELAREKLRDKAEFRLGQAADLPFSDNEFDIVSLIISLTFTEDLEKAITEAIRVCRGRVFIGAINAFSIAAMQIKLQAYFKQSNYRQKRFSSATELTGIVKRLLPGVSIKWGSVIFLSTGLYGFAGKFEETIPKMRNPFGAFLGISFPVSFNLITVQDIIGDPFRITQEEGQPVRGMIWDR